MSTFLNYLCDRLAKERPKLIFKRFEFSGAGKEKNLAQNSQTGFKYMLEQCQEIKLISADVNLTACKMLNKTYNLTRLTLSKSKLEPPRVI